MLGAILSLVSVILVFLILFLLNFYRDPIRKIPKDNVVVSPADGTIIEIIRFNSNKTIDIKQDSNKINNKKTLNKNSYKNIKNNENPLKIKKGMFGKIHTLTKDVGEDCYLISIFMSPFDVHVNRAPIEGKVESIKYKKGRFFSAFDFEKSLQNENNEIIIKNKKIGKVKVIQIAGFLARKIKCYVKENQKVNKGQKIGAIVLGSQVSLIISTKVKLKIKKEDKVKAGSGIIGYY